MLGAKFINIPQTTLHDRREQTRDNRHSPCEDEITKDGNVPKRDTSTGFQSEMLSSSRPQQMADDVGVADATSACVALVPVVTSAQWSRVPDQQLSRADFVTHLIATAEHAPQTRILRRATPAEARTAYSGQKHPVQGARIRTRQII
jgi:hypothetical protein